MYLPLNHNGQTYDLAPVEGYQGQFDVRVEREVAFNFVQDADGYWSHEDATVSESLGTLKVDPYNGHVLAYTRYNRGVGFARDLSDALAIIVNDGRPCTHPDGNGVGEDRYECTDCGATFEITETGSVVAVAYAHQGA